MYSYQNVQKFQLIGRWGKQKPKRKPNEAKVKQTTEITIFLPATLLMTTLKKGGCEQGSRGSRGVNCRALFENR